MNNEFAARFPISENVSLMLNFSVIHHFGELTVNACFFAVLVVPFCRTATAQRSFSYRAITAWNSLISEETKNSATLSVFKRAVKREIYDSP